MGKLKKLDYSTLNSAGNDIIKAIDMSYYRFVSQNPTIESVCDEKTMSDWYNFVAFCYCRNFFDNGSGWDHHWIKTNPDFPKPGTDKDDFDFEISLLMKEADNCAGVAWEKYDVDHQSDAWDLLRENPEWHSGEEDYDVDGDPYGLRWEILEDAYKEIGDSVQTSSFKKLSMISF